MAEGAATRETILTTVAMTDRTLKIQIATVMAGISPSRRLRRCEACPEQGCPTWRICVVNSRAIRKRLMPYLRLAAHIMILNATKRRRQTGRKLKQRLIHQMTRRLVFSPGD